MRRHRPGRGLSSRRDNRISKGLTFTASVKCSDSILPKSLNVLSFSTDCTFGLRRKKKRKPQSGPDPAQTFEDNIINSAVIGNNLISVRDLELQGNYCSSYFNNNSLSQISSQSNRTFLSLNAPRRTKSLNGLKQTEKLLTA